MTRQDDSVVSPIATEAQATARILLVDDDPVMLDSLGALLEMDGHEIETVSTFAEAVQHLAVSVFDLVLTDVAMPDGDGFDLLSHIRRNHGDMPVILVTSYGTVSAAVEAMRQGAQDYLTKPITHNEVRMAIQRCLAVSCALGGPRRSGASASPGRGFPQIIGHDYRMSKVLDMVEAVADSYTTVLLTGQSGTGKSLIARAIHANSPRAGGPFVEVACGALPETLLESELFGHVRGAFTNAVGDKLGKFAAADGGTIFLDEIATASPALQVKLLRVLQDRQFEPVGSNETRHVDVRVILATNHDLRSSVEAGLFREDLYYRVNVVNIELPTLCDRSGDIPLLARHFLGRFLASSSKRILGFSGEAIDAMKRHSWPGNIRELENCVERAVVLCRGAYIEVEHLPPDVSAGLRAVSPSLVPAGPASQPGEMLKQAMAGSERQIILAALQANKGNRQATARQLGINRTTLYKKMKRHGLDAM